MATEGTSLLAGVLTSLVIIIAGTGGFGFSSQTRSEIPWENLKAKGRQTGSNDQRVAGS